jgi:thioredoxin reductase
MDANPEILIAGGGAAGLAAGVTLARSRRRVVVVDSGAPRNAPAHAVHALLGREGTPPAELLAAGREELRGYGGELVSGEITAVTRRDDGRFAATLADGTVLSARRLVIATGLVDVLPDVPGLRERWGRDVLHCPYCHGWEVRDQQIAVLATGPMSVHQALLFSQLSDDVRFLAHGTVLPAEEAAKLAALGIEVTEGRVAGVEVDDDRLTGVRLADGTVVPAQAVVVAPRMLARAEAFAGIDITTEENPMGRFIPVDAAGRTGVPGVWAAGNVADLSAQVGASAAAGTFLGAQLNAELVMERLY